MLKILKNSWRSAKIANNENRCQTAGEKRPEKRKIIGKETREIGNAKKVRHSIYSTHKFPDFASSALPISMLIKIYCVSIICLAEVGRTQPFRKVK